MTAIQASTDLGNRIGLLYIKHIKLDLIEEVLDNDIAGATRLKQIAAGEIPIGIELPAFGSIQLLSFVDSQNITAININGVNQINNNIPFTAISTPSVIAALIETEVNNFDPGSDNFSAEVNGDTVTLRAPDGLGSTANGYTIIIVVDGGTVNSNIINPAGGYSVEDNSQFRTFYIDADESATRAIIAASATDITEVVVARPMSAAIISEEVDLVSGLATYTRKSSIQYLRLGSEAGLTDDLTNISTVGSANGDILYVSRKTAGETITAKFTGNLTLDGGPSDYAMATEGNTLSLRFSFALKKWIEFDRSSLLVHTDAALRADGISHVGKSGSRVVTVLAAGGTDTLTVGTNPNVTIIDGNGVTLLNNYSFIISGVPMNGEDFYVHYKPVADVGGKTVSIFGITLTEAQAETGVTAIAVFDAVGAVLEAKVMIDASTGVPTVQQFRDASFPFTSQNGVGSIPASTGGTTTLTVNVDDKVQGISGVSGLTSNFIILLSIVGAKAGDEFWIKYAAQITENAFEVRIGGVTPIVLTTKQSLIGGWCFYAHYNGVTWTVAGWPDMGSVLFKLATEFIGDGAITPSKLAGTGAVELIMSVGSFETNEEGDYKVEIPFACIVDKITSAVTKAIAATDDGILDAKDNSLASMGTIEHTALAAIGTLFTLIPSANNIFAAGEVLTLNYTKATNGGNTLVSIKVTRT